jgi:hypothetical protein
MATLVKCRACGRDVSVNAAACPNCGDPQRPQPPAVKTRRTASIEIMERLNAWLFWALVAFALIGIAAVFVMRAAQ